MYAVFGANFPKSTDILRFFPKKCRYVQIFTKITDKFTFFHKMYGVSPARAKSYYFITQLNTNKIASLGCNCSLFWC